MLPRSVPFLLLQEMEDAPKKPLQLSHVYVHVLRAYLIS